MEPNVIIPAPRGDYVELARTREYRGQRWRKHILNFGTLTHPKTGEPIAIDDAFYSKLTKNFENGVCDIVQAPVADANNKHTETPLANGGEVMGIGRDGGKIYVDLDVRDPSVQQGLKNGTILGASAFLHLDYTDTRTNQKVGPTLLHSCFTNRPYVTGLDDYKQVVAATMADSEEDVVVLSEEAAQMPEDRKAQILAELKSEFGIDVEALQASASAVPDTSALVTALTQALAPAGVALTNDGGQEVSLTDAVSAIAELSQSHVALTQTVSGLREKAARAEVKEYVRLGRVMPAQEDAFVDLAMNDRPMMERLLPVQPIVALNAQAGQGGEPQGASKHNYDVDSEVTRLAAQADQLAGRVPAGK